MISFGPDFVDQYRQAAGFVDQVLKGKKLADLPVQAPTNYEAFGLMVAPSQLARAAQVAKDVEAAARALGVRLQVLNTSSERDIDAAFATLLKRRAGALVVGSDPLFFRFSDKLIELAARHAMPAIYIVREFPEAGGLMSYGSRQNDAYRQAGIYVGKILQGAKPGDLPVMQPTKFELMINMKTAKALGLIVPLHLQQIVDEVIE